MIWAHTPAEREAITRALWALGYRRGGPNVEGVVASVLNCGIDGPLVIWAAPEFEIFLYTSVASLIFHHAHEYVAVNSLAHMQDYLRLKHLTKRPS